MAKPTSNKHAQGAFLGDKKVDGASNDVASEHMYDTNPKSIRAHQGFIANELAFWRFDEEREETAWQECDKVRHSMDPLQPLRCF